MLRHISRINIDSYRNKMRGENVTYIRICRFLDTSIASIIDSIILIVALIPIMMIIAPNAASGFTGWTWSDWLGKLLVQFFILYVG
jgi:hypothetical protein